MEHIINKTSEIIIGASAWLIFSWETEAHVGKDVKLMICFQYLFSVPTICSIDENSTAK